MTKSKIICWFSVKEAPLIGLAIGEALASAIGVKTITEMISNKVKEGIDGIKNAFNTSETLTIITLLNPITLLINGVELLSKAFARIPKIIKEINELTVENLEGSFRTIVEILQFLIKFAERVKIIIQSIIGSVTGLLQIFGVFAINLTILRTTIIGSLATIKLATTTLGIVWKTTFGKATVVIGIIIAAIAAFSTQISEAGSNLKDFKLISDE